MAGLQSSRLPYDFGLWYPLLGGGPIVRVDPLGPEDPIDYHSLPAGRARLLLPDVPPQGLVRTALSSVRRNPLKRALRALPTGVSGERFHLLPGTGGGYVLLSAKSGANYRAGLELLPGGRRRWRVARELLRLGSRIGLQSPPGALELAVVRREPRHRSHPPSFAMRGELAAVAGGVPGLNRKVTLLFRPTHGLPARFAKLSHSPASRKRVRHEIDALRTISDAFPGMGLAPRIIDDGELVLRAPGRSRPVAFLVQESLGGKRPSDSISAKHVEFLEHLHHRSLERVPLRELKSFRRDERTLARLAPRLDVEHARTMNALAEAIRAYFGDRAIPCAFAHGDFTPWNSRIKHRALSAFDWEYFDPCAPALSDLFHYIVQTGILVQHADAATIFETVVGALEGTARPLAEGALLPLRDALGAFALYLLHVAVADEAVQSIELPRFAQVDWLKTTRIALAKQLIGALTELSRGSDGLRHAV